MKCELYMLNNWTKECKDKNCYVDCYPFPHSHLLKVKKYFLCNDCNKYCEFLYEMCGPKMVGGHKSESTVGRIFKCENCNKDYYEEENLHEDFYFYFNYNDEILKLNQNKNYFKKFKDFLFQLI